MADPVARLLRLRAAEEAALRRALAEAMRARDAAGARRAAAVAALAHEASIAPSDAESPLVGAFAAWLPTARAAITVAVTAEQAAAATVERARAALAAARVAARACESVVEAQAVARRAADMRAAQVALDDFPRPARQDSR
jgi:hypothetical protein